MRRGGAGLPSLIISTMPFPLRACGPFSFTACGPSSFTACGPFPSLHVAPSLSLHVAPSLSLHVAPSLSLHVAPPLSLHVAPPPHCMRPLPLPPGVPISSQWLLPSQQLMVEWEGTFASSLPLRYEVSVGTSLGSGSVLSWMETEHSSLDHRHPRLLPTADYFVTVTAVAANGHSVTAWAIVHAVP